MDRRSFIQQSSLTVLSVSAFGNIQWNGHQFVANNPTTTDILGPFYRPGAPLRSNIVPSGSKGIPMNLKGTITSEDGKTAIANALVEIWQCDEKEYYDNVSDDYRFRGAQRTGPDGKYAFKTIVPVPYKANPNNEASWRPAHIHMRVSVPEQQDLITQIYFKGDKYIDKDRSAASPDAESRILSISSNSSGEKEVMFNVVMRKEFALDASSFEKIAGIYRMNDEMIEFRRMGDLLFIKRNGQFRTSLRYIGNNTFEEKIEGTKVVFELLPHGGAKATLNLRGSEITGEKFLKYNEQG